MKKIDAIIKTDLAVNWDKAVNYIPEVGTIIIYEYSDSLPKIKIGDGIHKVKDLSFLTTNEVINDTLIL